MPRLLVGWDVKQIRHHSIRINVITVSEEKRLLAAVAHLLEQKRYLLILLNIELGAVHSFTLQRTFHGWLAKVEFNKLAYSKSLERNYLGVNVIECLPDVLKYRLIWHEKVSFGFVNSLCRPINGLTLNSNSTDSYEKTYWR